LGVEQIYDITPQPIATLPNGSPVLYPAFPLSDQQLFTKAILQACDGLDGTVDGVIDNLPACLRRLDPSSYVFSGDHQRLQCADQKTNNCLSKVQIDAVENISEGPRNSRQQTLRAPAGAVAHDLTRRYAGCRNKSAIVLVAENSAVDDRTATTTPGD